MTKDDAFNKDFIKADSTAKGDKAGDKNNGARSAAKRAGGGKKNNPHAPRSRARRRAVQALYQWQLNPENAGVIVSQFLDEQDFNGVDIDYFRELLEGVENHRQDIDDHLAAYIDRVLEQVDPLERAILRLSSYELIYRMEVPVRVVLDEAVELARRFGSEQGHAYVNGVLDKLAKKTRAVELSKGS